jgi:hypothetical protein
MARCKGKSMTVQVVGIDWDTEIVVSDAPQLHDVIWLDLDSDPPQPYLITERHWGLRGQLSVFVSSTKKNVPKSVSH